MREARRAGSQPATAPITVRITFAVSVSDFDCGALPGPRDEGVPVFSLKVDRTEPDAQNRPAERTAVDQRRRSSADQLCSKALDRSHVAGVLAGAPPGSISVATIVRQFALSNRRCELLDVIGDAAELDVHVTGGVEDANNTREDRRVP